MSLFIKLFEFKRILQKLFNSRNLIAKYPKYGKTLDIIICILSSIAFANFSLDQIKYKSAPCHSNLEPKNGHQTLWFLHTVLNFHRFIIKLSKNVVWGYFFAVHPHKYNFYPAPVICQSPVPPLACMLAIKPGKEVLPSKQTECGENWKTILRGASCASVGLIGPHAVTEHPRAPLLFRE